MHNGFFGYVNKPAAYVPPPVIDIPVQESWTAAEITAISKLTAAEITTLRRLGALRTIPGKLPWQYTHESVVDCLRRYKHGPAVQARQGGFHG